ncbi:hypothetical protein Ddye_028217 [Dipteronia dyeriana]|uniref:Uncharacterized protein n=1 Tax=Dipteronia dyeriana TaxID=168575 RepID=A0AAD9TR19_9ROSI|nr:hypothetical protein Ddye_028217 [Dipteronia dyeriana]
MPIQPGLPSPLKFVLPSFFNSFSHESKMVRTAIRGLVRSQGSNRRRDIRQVEQNFVDHPYFRKQMRD